jgi:hypothetical protein
MLRGVRTIKNNVKKKCVPLGIGPMTSPFWHFQIEKRAKKKKKVILISFRISCKNRLINTCLQQCAVPDLYSIPIGLRDPPNESEMELNGSFNKPDQFASAFLRWILCELELRSLRLDVQRHQQCSHCWRVIWQLQLPWIYQNFHGSWYSLSTISVTNFPKAWALLVRAPSCVISYTCIWNLIKFHSSIWLVWGCPNSSHPFQGLHQYPLPLTQSPRISLSMTWIPSTRVKLHPEILISGWMRAISFLGNLCAWSRAEPLKKVNQKKSIYEVSWSTNGNNHQKSVQAMEWLATWMRTSNKNSTFSQNNCTVCMNCLEIQLHHRSIGPNSTSVTGLNMKFNFYFVSLVVCCSIFTLCAIAPGNRL